MLFETKPPESIRFNPNVAASKLSEEDKERLFISLNKDYAKALDEMRKEAWKKHRQGESVQLRDLE